MMSVQGEGRFTGLGVGPGDPELITLKAARLLREADVVSYLVNADGQSQARRIAAGLLQARSVAPREIGIFMPMSTDRQQANSAYDSAAAALSECLQQGLQVVFLCEGDPLFFGSFTYLLERLQGQFSCQVVPGISSVHAAASVLQQALTLQRESFVVVSGRHSDAQIIRALQDHDSVVIMKAGQARPRILAALAHTGRLADASYLENISRPHQRLVRDVTALDEPTGPYFSLFVVTRRERSSR